MSRLPQVSSREVVKAMQRMGYEQDHMRGSHIVLRQQTAPHRRLVVPDHNPLAKGTLRAIIRQAGLTVPEFLRLLR